MCLRKLGLGSTKISSFLSHNGVYLKKSAINHWIYEKGKPFTEVIRHKIPDSSKVLTKEKAYVLGVLCGDGYIRIQQSSHSYLVGLDVCDEDFADEFIRCFNKTYFISPNKKIRRRQTTSFIKNPKLQYIVNVTSKLVVEDLLQYSNFKTKTWIIPDQIKTADLEIKGLFLRGLYDSEGSIRLRKKGHTELSIFSVNEKSLLDVKNVLEKDFEIFTTLRHSRNVARLVTERFKSIKNFSDYIGFTIQRKQNILKYALSTYKRKGLRSYNKEFKLKVLRLLSDGYSAYKIGKILDFPYTNVYDFVKQKKGENYN